jgi:hypothetical protein
MKNDHSNNTMQDSSVAGKWTHRTVVKESNLGRVNFFIVSCSHHVVILYCTKNYYIKVVYFSKIYYHTSVYDPIVYSAIVDPTSQVLSLIFFFLLLILSIVGNLRSTSLG